MKWIGGLYLIYLGVRRFLEPEPGASGKAAHSNASALHLFGRGFMVSAANPKAVVFFATLFPLFLSQSHPWLPQLLILGSTFLVLDGLALTTYARLSERIRLVLKRFGWRWENRIVGALLVAAGVALANKEIE